MAKNNNISKKVNGRYRKNWEKGGSRGQQVKVDLGSGLRTFWHCVNACVLVENNFFGGCVIDA